MATGGFGFREADSHHAWFIATLPVLPVISARTPDFVHRCRAVLESRGDETTCLREAFFFPRTFFQQPKV